MGNLADGYIALNRLDEAKSVLDRGVAGGIEAGALGNQYYTLAFLRNDNGEMEKRFTMAMGKADYEDAMLSSQSDCQAGWWRARCEKRCLAILQKAGKRPQRQSRWLRTADTLAV